jgi:hypothetical protein
MGKKKKAKLSFPKTTIISSETMSKVLASQFRYAEVMSSTFLRGKFIYGSMVSEDRTEQWYKILESLDNETQSLVESLRMTATSIIVYSKLKFIVLIWDYDTINIYSSSNGDFWNLIVTSDKDKTIKKILSHDLITIMDVTEFEPLMNLYS